jgi:TRAP-type C4-dicarboxylate transport system substrate-binding protein
MQTRRPLSQAALCAAIAWAAFPASAQTVTLKAADVHPPGYPNVVAIENLGKKLETATNGHIKLQMFPGGVLGGSGINKFPFIGIDQRKESAEHIHRSK